MLHITRRVGESIIIDGDTKNSVLITINSFLGNQIKLGINAPKNIPVYREEVYRRMQAEKKRLQPPVCSDDDLNICQLLKNLSRHLSELESLTTLDKDALCHVHHAQDMARAVSALFTLTYINKIKGTS